ncbi:class I SAM-dependent methyltransferase [Candidatus Woesebacteria bacterium]|nr:class I SAM-dependent methyltransferase [Candidatus Woesebacteria bacterium]
MNQNTINQLNQINTDFYKTVATDFDESRQYFWYGWEKIPPLLDAFQDIRVADIGCGNGRFGQFLLEKCPQLKLSYTGIDANQTLLDFAQETLQGKIPALHLQQTDIVSALQKDEDFLQNQEFQLVTSFGVFHHIPTYELRLKLLKYLLSKVTKDGFLIISFWQFTSFERFQKKVVKEQDTNAQELLNQYDLNLTNLEKNDFILDWNRGHNALRYCHFTDETEQKRLVTEAQAELVKTYFADGKEGNVNQYVILIHKS